jgi:hypothetical protein
MIGVGDVWAFALEQSLFGQQVINTFALKVTATPPNITEAAFLNDAFANEDTGFNQDNDILSDFQNLQTNQVSYKNWIARRVTNVLTNSFVFPVPNAPVGLKAGDCETANLALSIYRKGLLAGRRSRGRIAVAGLPTTSMAAGKWDAATLISGTALAGDIAGIKVNGIGVTFELGYWSPGREYEEDGETVIVLPLFTYAVNAGPQETVRVQRSRTVGVGT